MKWRIAVLLVFGMLPWANLHAAEAQTTFQVKARVNAVCEITARDLDFAAYNAQSGGPLDGQTDLTATCTPGTTYTITLSAGVGAGATVNSRKMTNSAAATANLLSYSLYADASRTSSWGDTPGTNTPPAGTGTGAAVKHDVFGRIPAGQKVAAGNYSDTITVRIIY